jgi:hypothetical protein
MMKGKRLALAAALAAACLCLASRAAAAPEEIQVYLDDMTKPGYFGADFHNSFVCSGSTLSAYPGALPDEHLYRFTPEFYYGLSDTLEIGLYVLTTTAPGGVPNFDGNKLRLKYIAPHDDAEGAFWGANFEIGKTSLRVAEDPWNAEAKGIVGYRSGNWLVAANLNLDWGVSGPVNIPVSLDIDTKLAYKAGADYQLGFETYSEIGPLKSPGRLDQRSQMLYGVLDADIGKFDLNAGIGRGLTTQSDRWVIKFIVGVHF